MSKRPTSNTPPLKWRKRRRNGISSSREVLSLPSCLKSTLKSTEVMRIWHGNTEEPTAVRTSSARFPKPKLPPLAEHNIRFEEGLDILNALPTVPTRSKRKNRNNGVSPFFHPTFFQLPSLTYVLSRHEWRPGLPSEQQSWMNSFVMMAFKTTMIFQHALTASTISEPSNASIVFKSPSIVRHVLYNVMSVCHYTALRYVHRSPYDLTLTTLEGLEGRFLPAYKSSRTGTLFLPQPPTYPLPICRSLSTDPHH